MNDDKNFTVYWLNGERSVVSGKSIEAAFTTAGYGAGAVKAVDWYDNGTTESHRWDKESKQWVKYEPIHIHAGLIGTEIAEMLLRLFDDHRTIIVDYENKDQLVIEQQWGEFYKVGVLQYIQITYAEYFEGSYSGDPEDGEYHYMCTNTEYHNPNNPQFAIEMLIKRAMTEPTKATGNGITLEEIKNTQ